ncbi:MAG: winged helix-turn-helix transcriptional regulator [Candidatus Thermoplasmatota archaeon]|nr:winged helix-turn-helix transcriptional regulator [Candidatus Thermoplasmatota archaeon]
MDDVDFKILMALFENSRETYRNLVKKMKENEGLDLTENTVRKRIQSMIDSGIIEKFGININPAVFGFGVSIAIFEHGYNAFKRNFVEKLKKNERVMYAVDSIGTVSAIAFTFKDKDDMSRQIGAISSAMTPAKLVSTFIYENLPAISVKLTPLDLAIIQSIKDDARKTPLDIAKEVGASASSVKHRLESLVKNKIIDFTIIIQPFLIRDLIPYYLCITFNPNSNPADMEAAFSKVTKRFNKFWLRQRILEPPGFIMELYASTSQEVRENIEFLQEVKEVDKVIFFLPSRFYSFDRSG